MLTPWLKLLRVVNFPTVPGDVFVGAAAAMWWCECRAGSPQLWLSVGMAALSSCALYLYGLVDNDIVGAPTDAGRPIPDGEISMRAARIARAACLVLGFLPLAGVYRCHFEATALGAASYSLVPTALVFAIAAYNRSKRPTLMGLCRGINVLLGVAAVAPPIFWPRLFAEAPTSGATFAIALLVAVWIAYISAVTRYSEGEESDPERRRRVGLLIEGVVHLQMLALVVLTLLWPSHCTRRLLVAGAVMLVLLRTFKKVFKKVSAS